MRFQLLIFELCHVVSGHSVFESQPRKRSLYQASEKVDTNEMEIVDIYIL